jgi:hypothetical protein
LLSAILAGCAAEGDFGRRQSSVVADEILPAATRPLARQGSEPVSNFLLTDDERDLTDRSYHFLTPARPRAVYDQMLAGLKVTRSAPTEYLGEKPDVYFSALMTEPWRSSIPPYRRLIADMAADDALLDPLYAVADRVVRADRLRERGLPYITDLRADERDHVFARIAGNRALLRWLDDALAHRVLSYRYALQRLFIEIPEREAVRAERLLASLEARAGVSGPAAARPRPASPPSPTRHYRPWGEDEAVPQK